jgi:hypothetical protein
VGNPSAIKQINRSIQIQFSGIKFPGERPYFNQFPAIGIANRLEPQQYRAIWPKVERRHFAAAFIADHVLVLKKAVSGKNWHILDRFSFENLPVQSKQGVLFA